MEEVYSAKYLNFEKNYWWFKGRRDIISRILDGYKRDSTILEIGCSGGLLIKLLKKKGFSNIVGIDISNEAINQCKKNGLVNIQVMDGLKTDFKNEQFDIIIASDILEHIKEDKKALKEWKRILKTDGSLIVFVPAFNNLWSNHDVVSYHHRRYSKNLLRNHLKKLSFEIKKISYWNFISFFPASLVRFYQRYSKKEHKDQLYNINPFFNKIIIRILKFENYLLTKANLPVGLSIFAIAVKK